MSLTGVILIAAAFLAFGVLAQKIERSILTGPILFGALGLLVGPKGFGLIDLQVSNQILRFLAEVTLVVVLFSDATKVDFKELWASHNLPMRMLVLGMPMTALLGTGIAVLMLPELTLWEAALVAAILTPTDAALGRPVVDNESIPVRIRQTISAESGLNDGIALPLVLLMATLAGTPQEVTIGEWVADAAMQLVGGPAVGIFIGWFGGKLVARAHDRKWMDEASEGICALALAAACYAAAELAGGNGFIAAFTGGIAFGTALSRRCKFVYVFEDTEARVLVLATFGIVGAVLIPSIQSHLNARYLLFAFAALTVMRMVPIALSLIGKGLRWQTLTFLGWFGPRGLASVLFLMIVLGETDLVHRDAIVAVVVSTVTLSILAHGISSTPLARIYGEWMRDQDREENVHVESHRFL